MKASPLSLQPTHNPLLLPVSPKLLEWRIDQRGPSILSLTFSGNRVVTRRPCVTWWGGASVNQPIIICWIGSRVFPVAHISIIKITRVQSWNRDSKCTNAWIHDWVWILRYTYSYVRKSSHAWSLSLCVLCVLPCVKLKVGHGTTESKVDC